MTDAEDGVLYVAVCRDCDGGEDLPVEGRGPVGPYLLGTYHEDQTGHTVAYGRDGGQG